MSRGLIIVDAGHGQFGNPYPVIEGKFEGTQNYRLALFLRDALEARGFTVVLTRNRVEDNPSIVERGRMAGEMGALMVVSLHSNAPDAGTAPEIYQTVRGAEVYYSLAAPERNAEIATALLSAIVPTVGTPSRGIKTREHPERPGIDFYGVLRNSAEAGCPHAFIIEHGFHTNPEDAAFLADDACLRRLAEAEAEALANIL